MAAFRADLGGLCVNCFSSLIVAVLVSTGAGVHTQGAAPRELIVITPGVIFFGGLQDLTAAYEKETGTKITIKSSGMGRIVNDVKTLDPAPDVIMLPHELMSTLALDGGIKKGSFTPLGRSEMGLAVRAGAPHPDISTVEKLAAALKSAKAVMRSNPAGGSMVASVIENNVIKRPQFAGVNSPVSTKGEGGQALVRGEGDMAIQAICEILPYKEIELVGPLPRELAAWIDMSTAVSARSSKLDEGMKFIRYMTRPEATPLWTAKGTNMTSTTGRRHMRVLLALLLLLPAGLSAQEKPRVLFYPKPIVREYKAPMKPCHTPGGRQGEAQGSRELARAGHRRRQLCVVSGAGTGRNKARTADVSRFGRVVRRARR